MAMVALHLLARMDSILILRTYEVARLRTFSRLTLAVERLVVYSSDCFLARADRRDDDPGSSDDSWSVLRQHFTLGFFF